MKVLLLWALAGCSFDVAGIAPPPSPQPHEGDMARPIVPEPADLAMLPVSPPPPSAAEDMASAPITPLLTATIDPSTTPLIDQTAGTRDWAHWGLSGAGSFDHKSGGVIGNFVNIKSTTLQQLGNYPIGFSWSGGTPTARASDTHTGVYTFGTNAGFRLVVPADTTLQTLTLYGGGQQSQVQVKAHLGDGSAPDVTQSVMDLVDDFQTVVTVSFRAATPCPLTIEWTLLSPDGFVHLQAATLR
jgi:hypothetical protein